MATWALKGFMDIPVTPKSYFMPIRLAQETSTCTVPPRRPDSSRTAASPGGRSRLGFALFGGRREQTLDKDEDYMLWQPELTG